MTSLFFYSGSVNTGTLQFEIPNDVTPFVEATLKCSMTYTNVANVMKKPVEAEMSPKGLVGTPSMLLSLNHTDNKMKIGERRKFTLKILLTKMKCPLRIEVIMKKAFLSLI